MLLADDTGNVAAITAFSRFSRTLALHGFMSATGSDARPALRHDAYINTPQASPHYFDARYNWTSVRPTTYCQPADLAGRRSIPRACFLWYRKFLEFLHYRAFRGYYADDAAHWLPLASHFVDFRQ